MYGELGHLLQGRSFAGTLPLYPTRGFHPLDPI